MAANPFKPAEQVTPKVKAFLYGGWGTGKTHFGLHCPGKVAVIDTEGGTTFFRGRVPDFDVISTKSYRDVVAALDYIEANPGAYGTLVLDPITVIYDTLQEAALRARTAKAQQRASANHAAFDPDSVDLEMLDWGRIKRFYKTLMTRLANLPVHVIVTSREKDEMAKRGGDMVKVGVKPDAEKGTAYYFDVVLHCSAQGDRRIYTVQKDRTATLPLGSTHTDPTFETLFGTFIKTGGKAARKVASDDAAAVADAQVFGAEVASPVRIGELVALLGQAGFDADELRARRGWPPFAEMPADKIAELTAWAQSKVVEASAPAHVTTGTEAA